MDRSSLENLVAHLDPPDTPGEWRITNYREFHRHEKDGLETIEITWAIGDGEYEAVHAVVEPASPSDDPGAAADRAYEIGLDHALEATA